jgi:hypothetical protein
MFEHSGHGSSRVRGLNLQRSAELAKTFPHPNKSHRSLLDSSQLGALLARNASLLKTIERLSRAIIGGQQRGINNRKKL